jgi:purine-nucleoside phosphorylase
MTGAPPQAEARDHFSHAQYEETADAIRRRTRHTPEVLLILGSGLGALADQVAEADEVPYDDIVNWPVATVKGHAGQLVIGRLEGQFVAVMQGRPHFYEGYSPAHLTLPVRALRLLGAHTLIVTNAAGGLHADFKAGDVMLLTDHISLAGMAGNNPLRGPNDEVFGPRFPDMSQVYDRELRRVALEVAGREGLQLRQGVYVWLAGPSFETPAELRFLRAIGADAVGMSTVPETTVARQAGMRVVGFSGITNVAALAGESETTHEEVLEAGQTIGPKLATIVRGVLRGLPAVTAT